MLPVAVPARSERTRCTRPRGSKCLRNEGTGTHDHVSYDAPVGIFNGRVLRDTPSHGQCLTCRCPKSPARMSALLCTHVRTRAVEPQSTSDIESTTCDVLCMTVSGYRDGGRSTKHDRTCRIADVCRFTLRRKRRPAGYTGFDRSRALPPKHAEDRYHAARGRPLACVGDGHLPFREDAQNCVLPVPGPNRRYGRKPVLSSF